MLCSLALLNGAKHVSLRIAEALEPIRADDAAVKAYGVELGAQTVAALFQNVTGQEIRARPGANAGASCDDRQRE